MCGFAGFLGGSAEAMRDGAVLLKTMGDTIIHRGPNDAGYWFDTAGEIGFAHRRLSVLDLSPAGHQPMHSFGTRFTLVFNGEIYNHLLLRTKIEAAGWSRGWRGHSDTETLLAGFETWGILDTVKRAVGMFAIAVWDHSIQRLMLIRDRLGEKPLYYGWQGKGDDAVFLFGSELKALRPHPGFQNSINRGAIMLQLRHNAIPAPYSIYEGIFKLQPGCMVAVSLDERTPCLTSYWSGAETAEDGVATVLSGDENKLIEDLEILLSQAVDQQLLSDVPLGAFLSGGIDSSTIAALMQAQSSLPVKTFTIGFHEAAFNEADHAKAVAKHLGTEHTELYVTSSEAQAVIPMLPTMYDEPFSDSSQIPMFLVSQLAKQRVTVALSGDGGDELFSGYNRYQITERLWSKVSAVPKPVRGLVAMGLHRISPQAWNQVGKACKALLPRSARFADLGDKLHKGAKVLESDSVDALYLGLVSHWDDPASVVRGSAEPATLLTGDIPRLTGLDDVQRMMALDMLTYLPDDILVKVDRAAMAVSLETRVPFLDHRVVEYAWRLPQSMKLRNGQSKWILRQVLYRHVPKALIERPKMGFGVPIGAWLRGPLRQWAEALLDQKRLESEGFFYPGMIRKKWTEHLSGARNWEHHLWDILMFQAWYEQQ